MPEKVRHEHSGNESVPGAVPAGAVHDSAAQGNADQEAGNASQFDSGTGGQRRLYQLETEFLRRGALRKAPVCQQFNSDRRLNTQKRRRLRFESRRRPI